MIFLFINYIQYSWYYTNKVYIQEASSDSHIVYAQAIVFS